VRDVNEARKQGLINDAEAAELNAAAEAVAAAVAVDDFAPEEITPRLARLAEGKGPSQTLRRPTAAE
jgi:acyl-CoA dehydrogenase